MIKKKRKNIKSIIKDPISIVIVLLAILTIGVISFGVARDKKIRENNNKMAVAYEKEQKEKKDDVKNQCIVTFIDDDGMSAFLSKAKPIFDKNNVKASLAIIAGEVGENGHMPLSDLKTLENQGFEVNSHSYKSELHNISSEVALDEELTKAKKFLTDNNFKGKDVIVYPTGFNSNQTYNGRTGENTISHVKKYFKYGINAWGENGTTLDNYMIGRVDFNKDINTLKAAVDNSYNNKSYLIFMTHSWMQEFDANKLDTLVKYIQSKNIKIMTASEALKIEDKSTQ